MDAPVLGTRQPAEQGQLVVLESGPEEARRRVQPVFDVIADRLGEGTGEHGDKDVSATYLTSAPEQVA